MLYVIFVVSITYILGCWVFEQLLAEDKGFNSECPVLATHTHINIDVCFRKSCSLKANLITFQGDVCTFRLCHGGDLQLEKTPLGWDIYKLTGAYYL